MFIIFFFILFLAYLYLFFDKYSDKAHEVIEDDFYQSQARLSIHFYSSPFGINWLTPRKLLNSSLLNVLCPFNRSISHVAIEFQSSDSKTYEFTSMTDTGKSIYKHLFKDQIGLGMLLTIYPGKLENSGMLQEETSKKQFQGRVHTVSFLINDEIIERLKTYLEEYKEIGNDKKYSGLDKDPRYKEGSGCVNFSRSIVEIAGLEKEEFLNNWNRNILIPLSLVGPPQSMQKVSPLSLLTSKNMNSWAQVEESHQKITFWDIDTIFKDLKTLGLSLETKPNNKTDMTFRKRGQSYEFLIDRRDNKCPNDSFWLKREDSI